MASRSTTKPNRMGASNLNQDAMDLASILAGGVGKVEEVVPPGWMTVNELSKELGIKPSATRTRLKRIPHETKMFRINVGPYSRPTPHYRPLTRKPASPTRLPKV
jgi:hypothetical protein